MENEETRFYKIIGCSIDKEGMTVTHEQNHLFLPWDSITHSFALHLKKTNLQKVPFFILLTKEIPQFLFIEGSRLSNMKIKLDGALYIRHLSSKYMNTHKNKNGIDDEFRDIITKICSKFSWTFIDPPLRNLVRGEDTELPSFDSIDEIASYCDKTATSLGTVSKVISLTDEPLKEIQTLTGPLTRREEWKEGTTVDSRYVIQSILKGGMGIVYVALDNARKKFSAIKTYQDRYFLDETVSGQFEREAEIWVNLGKHRNIVQAEMVKTYDGKPYIFLEYVQGTDLETILKEGRLSVHTAIDYALQFCNGMKYAFSTLGLVHRDIKPSNCFVTRENIIKISDFGLGKILMESAKGDKGTPLSLEKDSDILSSATMVGTLPFMAPELFSDMKSAGVKTDIYAFGVTFYIMLTGKNPFMDDDPTEIIERHLTLVPDAPSLSNKEVPAVLNDMIARCLSKKPDDRYEGFDEIYEALKQVYYDHIGIEYDEKGQEDVFSEEDWIKKGVSLASLGLHAEAILTFDEALALNQRSPARIHKGTSLTALKKFDDAIGCFDEMLELYPDHWKVWYEKGDALRLKGSYEEALQCFKGALNLTTQQAPVIGQIGKVLEEQGRLTDALNYYDEALAQNQKMSEVWDYKGSLLMKMNRFETAQECFTEATSINPRFLEAHSRRGYALAELGFYSEAIKAFNLSLSLNGEYIPSLLGLAGCFKEQKEYDRAGEFYNKSLILEPHNLEAQLGRLRLLIIDSNYEAALDYITLIMEKNPDNLELMTDLAQTFYELGLHAETLQMCRTILQHDRGNWKISLLSKCARHWIHEHSAIMDEILQCSPLPEELVYRDLNSVLSITCNVREAISLLRYYTDRGPAAQVYFLMARLLKIEGRREEALEALEASQNSSPEAQALRDSLAEESRDCSGEEGDAPDRGRVTMSPEEWLVRGLELIRQRDFPEALQAFQNTLNGNPRICSAWFFAGKVFERLEHESDSKKYYSNFIQEFPQSPGFYREMLSYHTSALEQEAIEMIYKRRIGLFPSDHRAWMDYIRFLLKYGYFDKARMLATEIIRTYMEQWILSKESPEFLQIYGSIQLFLKRYYLARDTFQGLRAGNPENLAASYSLAKTLELSGKLHDAEELYLKTAESDDISLMADYQLSGLYLKMNERKKALAAINRAIEKRHNIPELLFRKAEVLFKTKDYSECMEICYKLYTADKEFFYAYMLHSRALEGKEKASADPLTRGVSANPHNIILLESLALNYMKTEDHIKALAAFDLVLSKDRTNVKSMIAQGICYYKCNNFQRALSCFQKAAEVNYKKPDIWILLGITHQRLNNGAVAETLFRQALSLAATNPLALVNMGFFLQEQGRLVEAQECAEKSIRLSSKYGPAWLLRARCCRTYGNIEEAQKSIRSALYFLPDDPGTLVLSGIIEYEAGELHLSMQNFKKASECREEDAVIWFDLAFIAFKDDKIDHAFKWVNTALNLKPLFFEALFLKALCLLEMQKEQSAQTIFQQASELDPEKYGKWKLLQSKNQNLLAPVKPMELEADPFFLPPVGELAFPDTITVFHLEKPEETLPLVKEL